jgi:hypothetical protein
MCLFLLTWLYPNHIKQLCGKKRNLFDTTYCHVDSPVFTNWKLPSLYRLDNHWLSQGCRLTATLRLGIKPSLQQHPGKILAGGLVHINRSNALLCSKLT